MTRGRAIAGWVLVGALIGAATSGPATGEAPTTTTAAAPNVVMVMTDDAAAGDEAFMPNVQADLAARGTTFSNSFVNVSLCCPSRATFLTGQYAHNDGVTGGDGYYKFDPTNDLPVWMQAAGYQTDQVGKFLNGYGVPPARCKKDPGRPGCLPPGEYKTQIPPGFTHWHASISDSETAVYDYELSEDSRVTFHGEAAGDYKGTVLTAKALAFLRNTPAGTPFFLNLDYQTPHRAHPDFPPDYCPNTAKPAPRDVGDFSTEPLPEPPSFNEADVSDKPSLIADLPPLDDAAVAQLTESYRCRLASLEHVDRAVGRIVDLLAADGRLENTLILFTSDNGYVQGEHRIMAGKVVPYEESIRVPLIVRGPGFPAGQTIDAPAINADYAPTIEAATSVAPGLVQDGRPLQDLVAHPARQRDFPLENYQSGHHLMPFQGVRTPRYAYIEYTDGEKELYDLNADPYELQNVAGDARYAATEAWLAARMREVTSCSGRACRTWTGPAPDPAP